MELLIETKPFDLENNWFNQFKFRLSGSLYDFKFKDYYQNNIDYSGNDLTGVPQTTINTLFDFTFFKTLKIDYSHYYTSKMPLNDANNIWSESTLIGNIQFSVPLKVDQSTYNFFLQIQNLYNTDYVLGFDINAFGGRYYNPSAKRNFILGVQMNF